MAQPKFTEDFKIDAIKQRTERGDSIADVSQRLGVRKYSHLLGASEFERFFGAGTK